MMYHAPYRADTYFLFKGKDKMAAAPPSGAPSSAPAPSGFLSPDKNKNVRNEEAVQIGMVVVALTAL
jgi:hypothetical protein